MTAVDAEKRRVSLSMKARHIGLQPPSHRVAAPRVSLSMKARHIGLQPPSHRVAAPRVSLSMKALALLVVSDQLKAEATNLAYHPPCY